MTDWSLLHVRDQDTHLDVHVPVGPAVLVVEPDSVHHLVLYVSQQVRTFPYRRTKMMFRLLYARNITEVDSLAQWKWIECNTYPTGAGPSVFENHII